MEQAQTNSGAKPPVLSASTAPTQPHVGPPPARAVYASPHTPDVSTRGIRDASWSASAVEQHHEAIDSLLQLPSNSQLLDQLPPSVGIPSPLFERRSSAQDALPTESSLLPTLDIAWQLMQHFRSCTNVPFPIMHMPTLELAVQAVCGSTAGASADDYLVVSRKYLSKTCAKYRHARARRGVAAETFPASVVVSYSSRTGKRYTPFAHWA